MKKRFNTTGVCIPSMHYMVNIDDKLDKIKKYIDRSDYFVINRPRKYGKTTTMYMLEQKLKQDYIVLSISFEGIGDDVFLKEEDFSKTFIELIADNIELTDENEAEKLIDEKNNVRNLRDVSKVITKFVKRSKKEVILFIDEVDKSSNNQLFLSFLGMLRNKYLLRQQGKDRTFSSIILAGVYDVKNLKLKLRDETETKYNSPWNIAVDFDVDMSFSSIEIETMLKEYCSETKTVINTKEISEELYKYTSGYPFLVSRICQILDEKLLHEGYEWNKEGITIAVKRLIEEKNTLFDDLVRNIENYNELSQYIFGMLINGETKNYNILNNIIQFGEMFGYFVNDNGKVRISNRIFEQVLYNYYSSKIESSISMDNYNFKDNFVTQTGLDFKKVLLRFQRTIIQSL
ncbi:AAA family ATPase [Clostridium butyricum]|uniref:AAA-like domain-containing protein n=1 Tax=Clostridium butyricum TaxID=1492 RepID=UPI000AD09483